MRECPECKRVYYDETLNFCLEDGAALIYGPQNDEPATALLNGADSSTRSLESPNSAAKRVAENRRSVIAGVVGLILVTTLGVGSYFYYGRASSKQIDSIAVMPFLNESGNPDVDYLSDGMTEILIGSLSQLANLNVKARTSVFRYKGKEIDPRAVASDLKVQAILTGRVLQRADNLTLYVELIDTATENVLWKADYQRKMTDLVALQNEIARDVSQKLSSRLTPADTQKLTKKNDTTNPEAYRLYLQGRFFWNKRIVADMGKAIGYFQQAIALDPNYALAYAGLADAVAQPNDLVPSVERRDKARAAIDRALAIDPDLAEAHTSLGHIMIRYDLDFSGAERELKRSLELDPKWIDTYQRLGEVYSFQGRFDESLSWMKKGLELEPFNVPMNTAYGATLYSARQYDEAIAQLNKTLELDSSHRNAHLLLFQIYAWKGMYGEAAEHHIAEFRATGQNEWIGRMKNAFEKSGWNGFIREELERYKTIKNSRLGPYLQWRTGEAATYMMMGDKERALAGLEAAVEAHEQPSLATLKIDPRWDPVRDDPRFAEILKKAGFRE